MGRPYPPGRPGFYRSFLSGAWNRDAMTTFLPHFLPQPPIMVIGAGPWAGAYLLRMCLAAPRAICFGRFARGEPLPLAAGDYLYIGSAQGRARHAPLLRRINRHLLRCAPGTAQRLYPIWQAFLTEQKLRLPAPPKRLHWHIDYLLDQPVCDVTQVLLMPSSHPVEHRLTEVLEAVPGVRPVAPGLGASDHPGHTHLLHWQGTGDGWDRLLADLPSLASSAGAA